MLPRFYMKYLQAVSFILFLPGKRDGITGYSPDIDSDTDEEDQRMITKETELAKEFDRKLTREIPRGAIDIVDITEKVCGWGASMLEKNLEDAQYMGAIMSLPRSHPAYKAMLENFMSSLERR